MEEESFNDVMGHAPVYSSGLPGVSVTNPAEFKEWHGRVRRAHEREVDALRGETYLDAVSDAVLAKHGLVRLPVDADGVPWTGEEHFFRDAQVGGARFLFGLSYFGDGKWEIIDHYQNEVGAAPAMCRHVPEKPAGPHAALAAELRSAVRKGYEHGYGSAGDYRAALYNIAERLAQMDGDDGKEQ